MIDSPSRLSMMAWKIRAYGSARAISNLSFLAQLGSRNSSFEPLWLGSAQPKVVGLTIPDLSDGVTVGEGTLVLFLQLQLYCAYKSPRRLGLSRSAHEEKNTKKVPPPKKNT
jgi:hypothetical protein